MKRLLTLGLLLATAGVAAAQQQMPDPRQMSGIPRPDEKVEPGLLTVKVLYGEIAAFAPVGTPVHLIAIDASGTTTVITNAVNDEGRAEFPGLDRTGRTAYYALCLLGDDRLESDVVVLPPQVGVRLMLAGRKHDQAGAPIGPPIDDEMRGREEEPAVPAGHVEIHVRGHGGAKMPVRLVELTTGAVRHGDATGAEGDLAVTFEDVAGGPALLYVAEVVLAGRAYLSQPFMLSALAGTRRGILAHDKLLFGLQGGAQLDDENLVLQLSLGVANLTGAPYDVGPNGLFMPLPEGAESVSIQGDNPGERFKLEPGGVRFTGTMPPGQRDVVVQLTMPVKDGEVHLVMPAPLGILESQIVLEHSQGVEVTPGPSTSVKPKLTKGDDGREFVMLSDLVVNPGTSLDLDITGLPVRPRALYFAAVLAGLIVLALLAWAISVALRRPPTRARRAAATSAAEARKELESHRDHLYERLVALERMRMQQRIDDDRYASERRSLIAKLVVVHRDLDDLERPSAPKSKGDKSAPAS